jgi:hypothetical protein
VHVSAASLKQSVFHHEDDEELTRLLNQGTGIQERVGRGFETRSAPASLAATLAALPSISEIPFPRFPCSCFPYLNLCKSAQSADTFIRVIRGCFALTRRCNF